MEVRIASIVFRYWKSGSTSYTSWQGSIHSGDTFSRTLTNLDSDTLYYAKAQAKNSIGTGDGSTLSFHTETLPVQQYRLTLSSTEGGAVTQPGEGAFTYDEGTAVAVVAEAQRGYGFDHWTGMAVDKGYVIDTTDPSISLTLTEDLTLNAHFFLAYDPNCLYVDNNSVNDPGPLDPCTSDPWEDGSLDHPFDTIQEAIDTAQDGMTVCVYDGTYVENLVIAHKSISLLRAQTDANLALLQVVVDANGLGSVVSWTESIEPNGLIDGFILTGGAGPWGGGLYCEGANDLTLANCVLVNNDANTGAGIYANHTNLDLVNCTVLNNTDLTLGGIVVVDANMNITNSILWGNLPQQIQVINGNEPNVTYSCVEGGCPGLGNRVDDLRFLAWPDDSMDYDNYHLDANSPCVDAGDPCAVVGHFDIDLQERIVGAGVDMGADEVDSSQPIYTDAFDLLIYDYPDQQVERWDPHTGLDEGIYLPKHGDYLMTVAGWTPEGELCMVVGNYDLVGRWDGSSLVTILQDPSLGGISDAAFQILGQQTYLLLADTDNQQILRYRYAQGTASQKEVFISSGPQWPRGMALHPISGDLYVTSPGSNRIMAFDGTTGNLLESWSTGLSYPIYVAIDQTGSHMAVSNLNSNKVVIYDLPDKSPARSISVSHPEEIGYGPDGQLYILKNSSGQVLKVTDTGTTVVVSGLAGPSTFTFVGE